MAESDRGEGEKNGLTMYDFNQDYNNTMKNKFVYKKCKFVCYNGMNHTFKTPFEKLMDEVFK